MYMIGTYEDDNHHMSRIVRHGNIRLKAGLDNVNLCN